MHANALAKRFIAARERIDQAVEQLAGLYGISRPPSEFDARALRDPDIRHLSELQQLAAVVEQLVAVLEQQQQEVRDARQQAPADRPGVRLVRRAGA